MKNEVKSEEEKALPFEDDLLGMLNGQLSRDRYNWLKEGSIDYEQVSTPVSNRIVCLLGENPDNSPDTPKKTQIQRQINLVVSEKAFTIARRVVQAKALETALHTSVDPVFDFLKAAKQPVLEFEFPCPEQDLLALLAAAHNKLNKVANMVKGSIDFAMTESDSSDPDA
ncbi:hypothetical protein MVEN_00143100 [Mycena venus]|uniref:Uncharacterized protein n=1 Tax=Mycena venus TaxID=2733690 RepID=A0A8H7DE57_9AGAR|nr:hypothetical protein MVEN_00143100 [Mycena venus]